MDYPINPIKQALAAGANTVMIGSLFAGHEESPGQTVEVDGRLYKEYYGSASDFNKGEYKHVEGKRIRYRYPGADGGRTLTYVGFQEPLEVIPAASLLRVSLAHWWKPREAPPEEEETYGEEALGAGSRALQEQGRASRSVETSGAEGEASLENLLSLTWQPVSGDPKYGILPLVVGSLKVTFLAILIGAPIATVSSRSSASAFGMLSQSQRKA